MKDFLEPLLYPHNILLWGLVLAAIRYRKLGLWLLVIWYYGFGNGYVANQVRAWYNQHIQQSAPPAGFTGDFVVLGCGGSATDLPECAKKRLDQVAEFVTNRQDVVHITMTTLYCQPYLDYLQAKVPASSVLSCFHGGATTYHEFYNLDKRLERGRSYAFITSDYHAYRVKQLATRYQFEHVVIAAPSSTYRPVNCSANCWLTVNLSNLDFFAKLSSEMLSYTIYRLTADWTDWYKTLDASELPPP